MNDYTSFADIYDDFMDEQFVARLLDVLEHYTRRFPPPGNRLLDLGCGTGTVGIEFARRGWEVIGVDVSAAMLEKARAKAKEAGVSVDWRERDMTSFKLRKRVSLVTCTADSINHLRREEDVAETFRRLSRALTPGGVFIFDINTPYTLERAWSDQTHVGRRGLVSYSWKHHWDEKKQMSRLDGTFKLEREGEPVTITQRFWEKAYEVDVLSRLLERAGLQLLDSADFFSLARLTPTSTRAVLVGGKRL
ncbi:MAG: class I SAM-dependent methyltransferase [Actinobacteria bacterium]|nr:MAG: class I SAM-dependent methyltransferase [Actinomycetota bacterium]